MELSKNLPLTETTFFILMALREEGHGYHVMQKVEEMSEGRVRIAAGTMYGAVENLLKLGWIVAVPSEDKRRKVYQTTEEGRAMLKLEIERLHQLITVAEKYGEEGSGMK